MNIFEKSFRPSFASIILNVIFFSYLAECSFLAIVYNLCVLDASLASKKFWDLRSMALGGTLFGLGCGWGLLLVALLL